MRKFFKFLKYSFYTVLVLILLVLATIYVGHKFIFPVPFNDVVTVPDIRDDGFCFGVNCHPKTETAEEFLQIFADQIKNYNNIAPALWPDNKVVDLHVVVQSIEHGNSWHVSPDGKIKDLSRSELKELCPVRAKYNIGFVPFENDTIRGVYLALSEVGLKNVMEYEKYQYLGTYDLFLTYSHEMFHIMEQDGTWTMPDTVHNRSRNPKLENVEARTERNFMFRQILKANSAQSPEERDSLILQVLSNYENYKSNYPDDHKAAMYFDRIEGTAHYYEIISSLYSAYPDQINSPESLRRAIKVLAGNQNSKAYEAPGVDNESYIIGAWTGFLLDELQEDNSKWKTDIMQDPYLTPLDLLSQIFEGETLPPPVKPTDKMRQDMENAIQELQNQKRAPAIFRMLYQLIF